MTLSWTYANPWKTGTVEEEKEEWKRNKREGEGGREKKRKDGERKWNEKRWKDERHAVA